MDCKNTSKLLCEYIDNSLDSNIKSELENHIKTCSSCAKELSSLKSAVASLNTAPKHKAPADFLKQVHRKISNSKPAYAPRFNFGWGIAGAAISLLLIFSLKEKVTEYDYSPVTNTETKAGSILTESSNNQALRKDSVIYQYAPSSVIKSDKSVIENKKKEFLQREARYKSPEQNENILDARQDVSESNGDGYAPSQLAMSMKSAAKKPQAKSAEELINEALKEADGKITYTKINNITKKTEQIIVEIPSSNHAAFMQKLSQITNIKPTVTRQKNGRFGVKILFEEPK